MRFVQGSRAFVSFVRGYKEHQCRFIFRFKELSLARLASTFALLRMPRMPETKRLGATAPYFTPSDVAPDDVPYKDRAREKLRLQRRVDDAAAAAAERAARGPDRPRPAPEAGGAPAAPEPEAARPTAHKRRQEQTRADDDDLDSEYRLLKKLKRGAISEHQFNVAVGLSDSEGDGDDGDDGEAAVAAKRAANAAKKAAKKKALKQQKGGGKGGGGGDSGGDRAPRSQPRHVRFGGGGRGGGRGRGRR
jgi:ATP-dependent RNA helicase DDX55/SPB4